MTRKASFFSALAKDFKVNKTLVFMSLILVFYYGLFHYGPMYGILVAFKDFRIARGFSGSAWAEPLTKHFRIFFESYYFKRLLVNTLSISFKSLIFGFPAPIILALLLNEVGSPSYKKIIQTVTYMPHFISMMVMCGILIQFFSAQGLINDILSIFGVQRLNYFLDSRYYQGLYVGSGIWQNLGWNSIIFLAAISRVNPELYEACRIDGGNRWTLAVHVTIPRILPTIITMFILQMGQLMSIGAQKTILLYNPTTYETADIIASYVYRTGIQQSNYSFATAVGLFNNVINCILLFGTNAASKKLADTGLW
ncbi:MAG: ABC transporter permease subunit [Treponema sp.]|nr:ABC transporter permease subunit [Treponema sp.]